jgi:uncharacterized protein YciI
MEVRTVPYFLVLLEASANRQQEEKYRAQHMEFIDSMIEQNKVLLGGSLGTGLKEMEGAYLLNVRTYAQAEAWVLKDPYVEHNIYTTHIIQWDLVGIDKNAIDPLLI